MEFIKRNGEYHIIGYTPEELKDMFDMASYAMNQRFPLSSHCLEKTQLKNLISYIKIPTYKKNSVLPDIKKFEEYHFKYVVFIYKNHSCVAVFSEWIRKLCANILYISAILLKNWCFLDNMKEGNNLIYEK